MIIYLYISNLYKCKKENAMAVNETKVGGVAPSDVPSHFKLSKLSLTFGIMSLLLLPIFAIPGLITGLLAGAREKQARRFYVPGIVTSAISLALLIIVFILFRIVLAVFGLSLSDLKDIEHCMQVIADFIVSHS